MPKQIELKRRSSFYRGTLPASIAISLMCSVLIALMLVGVEDLHQLLMSRMWSRVGLGGDV